ncbi:hypothetical protein QE152_g8440 [Popillia japonica]|uniref:Uncharacterized protein n=1 Tax=Popillia japonica TaxID=7064 RepID=A0AAW1MBM9_POPJA
MARHVSPAHLELTRSERSPRLFRSPDRFHLVLFFYFSETVTRIRARCDPLQSQAPGPIPVDITAAKAPRVITACSIPRYKNGATAPAGRLSDCDVTNGATRLLHS